jgi:hypothetical protein
MRSSPLPVSAVAVRQACSACHVPVTNLLDLQMSERAQMQIMRESTRLIACCPPGVCVVCACLEARLLAVPVCCKQQNRLASGIDKVPCQEFPKS